MALLQLNFESKYLRNNHAISIILPNLRYGEETHAFYRKDKKYPVLWLLHGTFGDHTDWVRNSNIERYACEKNLIVVMPSALNSAYENWPFFALGFDMYDYFIHELMPLVYAWFPASDRRADNFIAGLSMGGRGALKIALANPELFAGAAMLSSVPRNLNEVSDLNELAQMDGRQLLTAYKSQNDMAGKAFMDFRQHNDIQNAGSVEAYLRSNENTWDRLRELVGTYELPRLYFACGTEDFGYEQFLNFQKYAQQISLDAFFEEGPGGHEWRFWDQYIQNAISFLLPKHN